MNDVGFYYDLLSNWFKMFNIINESCDSRIIIVITLIIEILQKFYLMFNPIFEIHLDSRFQILKNITKYFFFGFPHYDETEIEFYLVFCIFSAVVIFIDLSFLICYFMVKYNVVNLKFFKVFSYLKALFLRIITIPFLAFYAKYTFITEILTFNCSNNCFLMIKIISAILFSNVIIISFINSSFDKNYYPENENYNSFKLSSNYTIIEEFKKLTLVILFSVNEPFKQYNEWFLIIFLVIFNVLDLVYILIKKPFFSNFMTKFKICLKGLMLFYSLWILLSINITNYVFDLAILIIGTAVILIAVYVIDYSSLEISQQIKLLIEEDEIHLNNILFITFLFDSNLKENHLLAKAFIINKINIEQEFVDENKNLLDQIEENIMCFNGLYHIDNLKKRKKIKTELKIEESERILNFLSNTYKFYIEKFKNSVCLKLYYIYFIIKYLKNFYYSKYLIDGLMEKKDELHIMELYFLTMLEIKNTYYMNSHIQTKLNSEEQDTIYIFGLLSNENIVVEEMKTITKILGNLWENIIETYSNNISYYYDLIITIQDKIEKFKLLDFENFNLSYRSLYNIQLFSKNVINDSYIFEIVTKLREQSIKKNSNDTYIRNNVINYIIEGNAYIIINAEDHYKLNKVNLDNDVDISNKEIFKNNIGDIININNTCCSMFGFVKDELIGKKNVNSIIPKFMRNNHEKNIKNIFNNDLSDKKSKEFKRIYSFGLNKSGYIFPVNMSLSLLNGLNMKNSILGLIRREESIDIIKNKAYIIIDNEFNVQNISSKITTELGLKLNELKLVEEDKKEKENQIISKFKSSIKNNENLTKKASQIINSNEVVNSSIIKSNRDLVKISKKDVVVKDSSILDVATYSNLVKIDTIIPDLYLEYNNSNVFDKYMNQNENELLTVDVNIFKNDNCAEFSHIELMHLNSNNFTKLKSYYQQKFYIKIFRIKIANRPLGYTILLEKSDIKITLYKQIDYKKDILRFDLNMRKFSNADHPNSVNKSIVSGSNSNSFNSNLNNLKKSFTQNRGVIEQNLESSTFNKPNQIISDNKQVEIFLAANNIVDFSEKIDLKEINMKLKGNNTFIDVENTKMEIYTKLKSFDKALNINMDIEFEEEGTLSENYIEKIHLFNSFMSHIKFNKQLKLRFDLRMIFILMKFLSIMYLILKLVIIIIFIIFLDQYYINFNLNLSRYLKMSDLNYSINTVEILLRLNKNINFLKLKSSINTETSFFINEFENNIIDNINKIINKYEVDLEEYLTFEKKVTNAELFEVDFINDEGVVNKLKFNDRDIYEYIYSIIKDISLDLNKNLIMHEENVSDIIHNIIEKISNNEIEDLDIENTETINSYKKKILNSILLHIGLIIFFILSVILILIGKRKIVKSLSLIINLPKQTVKNLLENTDKFMKLIMKYLKKHNKESINNIFVNKEDKSEDSMESFSKNNSDSKTLDDEIENKYNEIKRLDDMNNNPDKNKEKLIKYTLGFYYIFIKFCCFILIFDMSFFAYFVHQYSNFGTGRRATIKELINISKLDNSLFAITSIFDLLNESKISNIENKFNNTLINSQYLEDIIHEFNNKDFFTFSDSMNKLSTINSLNIKNYFYIYDYGKCYDISVLNDNTKKYCDLIKDTNINNQMRIALMLNEIDITLNKDTNSISNSLTTTNSDNKKITKLEGKHVIFKIPDLDENMFLKENSISQINLIKTVIKNYYIYLTFSEIENNLSKRLLVSYYQDKISNDMQILIIFSVFYLLSVIITFTISYYFLGTEFYESIYKFISFMFILPKDHFIKNEEYIDFLIKDFVDDSIGN